MHQAIADEGIVRHLARAPWLYTADDAAQAHDALYPAFLLMLRTYGAPRLIGACGLGNYDGSVELGYWIARPYWGLGFATEASSAVVNIAKAIGHIKSSLPATSPTTPRQAKCCANSAFKIQARRPYGTATAAARQ